jgi:hypothetical protein
MCLIARKAVNHGFEVPRKKASRPLTLLQSTLSITGTEENDAKFECTNPLYRPLFESEHHRMNNNKKQSLKTTLDSLSTQHKETWSKSVQ